MFSFLKKFWAGFFFKNATTPPPQKVHPHPPPRGTDGHWWLSFFSFFYSAPSGAISYFFYGGEGCGKIWWKNHWWLWLTTDGTLTYDNIIWIFFSKLCCDKVILPVAVLVKIRCTSRSPSMNPWWGRDRPQRCLTGDGTLLQWRMPRPHYAHCDFATVISNFENSSWWYCRSMSALTYYVDACGWLHGRNPTNICIFGIFLKFLKKCTFCFNF